MWRAAIKSTEQYAADFDERTITSFVPASDVALLALLGMWLERRWTSRVAGTTWDLLGSQMA